MKKLLLVVASAAGLAACTFPQTKMEPVGETQMQTQQAQPPSGGSDDAPATSAKRASGKSGASVR